MSKIGQKQIEVSSAVTAEVTQNKIHIKGPLGQVSIELPNGLEATKKENVISIKRLKEDKKTKSLHGLYRQLIYNAVTGAEKAWEKRLEVVGTGYNVKMQGEDLIFKLGYSHPSLFKKVPGISYKVEGNNKVVVSGSDKQLVGQVSYQIKSLRKPDAYKGKGIRYEGEILRIKPGKKAKAAGGAPGAAS